jgi:hypothetical protein
MRQLLNHTSGVFNSADVEDDAYTDLLLTDQKKETLSKMLMNNV